jgi:hypothetical protein
MSSGILPKAAIDRVTFFENHTADWAANAVAIGTTTTAVTALTTKTTAARAAYNAQQLAQAQAKAATQTFKDAVAAMTTAGSDIIKQVKAKAATDGNSIYALALLPVPALPSPVPAPGTPSNFAVELRGDGSLVLSWKCANPAGSQGTIYQVSRRLGGSGDFSVIGASGKKEFTDETLPAGSGSAPVTYQIVAIRSTVAGAPAQFTVNFGVAAGGGGEMTASVESAPKLAA